MKAANRSGKILKKLLIGVGAFLVLLFLSAYVFTHFYFQRTFSRQITGVIIRCSDAIQAKSASGDWQPLRVGDSLTKGMRIRTPEARQAFMSFDGLRLLSEGASEIEIMGARSFSVVSGDIGVAVAKTNNSLRVPAGTSTLTTKESVFNISAEEGAYIVVCISGTAGLRTQRGAEHNLASGQQATISADSVVLASVQSQNPFAVGKASTLTRIRERFDKVMAAYAARFAAREGQSHARVPGVTRDSFARGGGWQFASFTRGDFLNLSQASAAADYYEKLFAPSNRTISIGKQKSVPLTPYYAASFPIWSHDGSMIAFVEASTVSWPARVRVVRLDDPNNPWDISQEYDTVLPFFPIAWAPDDRHVLFMVADHMDFNKWGWLWWWSGPYHIKIAPINPEEAPIREFDSPFHDMPMLLPLPVGKTLSPWILKLPWGDAMLCANWGNLAYIPIEQDGQSVPSAPGLFLTNFNPREFFVMGGGWSPSGSMILFTAAEDLDFDRLNTYILYDVEDILDGFTEPPRSPNDPRLKKLAPSRNPQMPSNFSFDESLAFFAEDVNGAWRAINPTYMYDCDFDMFYADARPDQPSRHTQIHLPGSQLFLRLSPEGNRLAYTQYQDPLYELRIVSFDVEADMDMDLGGVLIDNSGTNLIVPPGTLEENFKVKISTPLSIGEEAVMEEGEQQIFALRLLDAEGIDKPQFIEPMTLTIRYTDDEVAGLDEGMLEIYYYDESNPEHPVWVPVGGTVDPDNNEITVEIQHFSKFSIGQRKGFR
ncbi:MAG: hypothetical protein C4532_05480 [Candidatus Abyssobacteria bacterium SURF_17]|uniref:FecR protein domain-containing protein n=1 Tax=Candidatus Abyssobacteria bacterium SURF_17 TaxID=2093361 RepID=A0A419F2M1_9BACT|nr:MAG: hypothetical protein C4532_05480 [Candidatus Abyssubacteria bacterium SURF_17]